MTIEQKILRLEKRHKGLSRVTAAINDLYIYGITSQNFPHLMEVLENAKDHVKEQIRDCKYEIAVDSGLQVKELPPTDPLKQEKKMVDVEDLYKGGL